MSSAAETLDLDAEGPSITHVIETLPREVYDNPTALGLAFFARDVAVYGAVMTALALTDHPLLLIPLWCVAALSISALFIVGHDAAHGALFKSKRLTYWIGQISMLPSLHVYEAWVFGHNRIHHGHTVREVMDYVWHPTSPEAYHGFTPLQKFMHRWKWSWLGAGVYYGWDIWWKSMMRFTPPAKIAAEVRRDRAIVWSFAALVTVALFTWGALSYGTLAGAIWMWTKMFLVPFVLWNYSIGFAVYVHHISTDIEWHGRREWTRFHGQMEGTTILHVPAWMNFFYHNIFLHVPHHVDMRIPFYRLPLATEVIVKHFGDVVREKPYNIPDYIRTTRACKLYDFATHTWHGYEASRPEAIPATEPAPAQP